MNASPEGWFGLVVAAIAAAACGSLFAAGDAALTALPEARLQALVLLGRRSAFHRYSSDRLRVLSRWLVCRVISVSLAAALFGLAAERASFPGLSPIVAVLGAVLTYATFAEILGTIARIRPEQVGALALRTLWPIEWAVAPLAEPLAMLGRFVGGKLVPRPPVDARLTETEVEWVVSEGERAGSLANEPAEMIRKVLDFKDLTARDVMVPRRQISGLDIGTPLEKVLAHIQAEGHSRYPVYRETLDNIVGLLYAKDIFPIVRQNRTTSARLAELVRAPVLFVVETQSALSILREMRARRLHMAIVSDEFGGTSGLVTLEDIIEEIVGEIRDEYDTEADAQIHQLDDGRLVADAAISLADLSARLGRELPTDGDFESLGGLLIHKAGRVPTVGSTMLFDDWKFIVREADETHVVKVEIVPAHSEQAPIVASAG